MFTGRSVVPLRQFSARAVVLFTAPVPHAVLRRRGSQAGNGTRCLHHDGANRLVRVELPDGSLVEQTYTAQGQRATYCQVFKPGAAGTPVLSLDERFLYQGSRLAELQVRQDDGTRCKGADTTCTEVFLYRPDGLPLTLQYYATATPTSSTPLDRYWYVLDDHGSVTYLVDQNGDVQSSYDYDSWGALTSPASTIQVPQPFRYAGYVWDDELETYWLSVRQYDPQLKRFLQPDPSEQEGVRSYVYCHDDPLDSTDPSGLEDEGPGGETQQMPSMDGTLGIELPADIAEPLPIEPLVATQPAVEAGLAEAGTRTAAAALGDETRMLSNSTSVQQGLFSNEELERVGAVRALGDQRHHFATDKNPAYTPLMQTIARRYGLELDEAWNTDLLPHSGRHPNTYHDFVLSSMQRAADEAGDDRATFLELFEQYVEAPVLASPDLLYARGWR